MDILRRLLSTPTEELGKFARFVVFQIKLWRYCGRELRVNRATQQAAALSYQTIFGIVPVMIVMLMIFQAVPASDEVSGRIKNMVYSQLHLTAVEIPSPSEPGKSIELTAHLEALMEKFVSEQSRGTVTILSTAFIIWAAIALLTTIERIFNHICNISKGRTLVQRVRDYWAILTLGPLLIAVAIYITTKFAAVETVTHMIAPTIVNYVLSVAGFFLLYLVMPNTTLRFRPLLWGSAVAALAWTIVKSGFGSYVVYAKPYATLYGALALIPLSVLWVWITWLIVLFGLELTYTTQYLKTLDAADQAAKRRREGYFIGGDISAMNIMAFAASAFIKHKGPVAEEALCNGLNMPAEFAEKMLGHLVKSGLLVKTSEPSIGYAPAMNPKDIRLSDIAKAVDEAGIAKNTGAVKEATMKMRAEAIEKLSGHTLAELADDWG